MNTGLQPTLIHKIEEKVHVLIKNWLFDSKSPSSGHFAGSGDLLNAIIICRFDIILLEFTPQSVTGDTENLRRFHFFPAAMFHYA